MLADVPSAYKQRWSIENRYKAIERAGGQTFTPNFGARLLSFYTSVMWCDLWYMADATEKRQAAKGGMPRRQVEKIHTVLRMFMLMIIDVSRAVLGMDRSQTRRYLDGGGSGPAQAAATDLRLAAPTVPRGAQDLPVCREFFHDPGAFARGAATNAPGARSLLRILRRRGRI